MFTISATILAIVIAVTAGLSFTGGYTISNWRAAAKITRLETQDSVLTQANAQCKASIDSVRESVAKMEQAAEEKIKQAQAEAIKAQPKADKHTAKAVSMIATPIKQDETECKAVEREQLDYLQWRQKS